jgi:hypothetical protein
MTKIWANSGDAHLVEPDDLFDDVDPETRQRVTLGAFQELFPHVTPAPATNL